MALTEEQKARIAQNRELAIAKRREREAASATPEAKRARRRQAQWDKAKKKTRSVFSA